MHSLPPKCFRASQRRLQVDGLDEPAGIGGSVFALHSRIVPVHCQWSFISYRIERAYDCRPVNPPVARGAELPAGPWIAAGPVAGEYSGPAIECELCILDVY